MFRTRKGNALGIALALVAAGLFAAAAHATKPTGMSQQEYAALMVRSAALNKLYGLGTYAPRSRDEALNARYGNDWTKLSPGEFKVLVDLFGAEVTTVPLQEVRARITRGTSLGRPHGNGSSTTFARPGGFDWGDSAVGVAAALGVVLLWSAAAIAVRSGGRPAAAQQEARV